MFAGTLGSFGISITGIITGQLDLRWPLQFLRFDGTREPDFFQLLNFAGKRLGRHQRQATILSLGASIIDQYRQWRDDAPTVIEYAGPPAPSPAPPNPRGYGRETSAPSPVPSPTPIVLNRPLRNPGELGYAYKNSTATLDFHTSTSADTSILDLFSMSPANPAGRCHQPQHSQLCRPGCDD